MITQDTKHSLKYINESYDDDASDQETFFQSSVVVAFSLTGVVHWVVFRCCSRFKDQCIVYALWHTVLSAQCTLAILLWHQ